MKHFSSESTTINQDKSGGGERVRVGKPVFGTRAAGADRPATVLGVWIRCQLLGPRLARLDFTSAIIATGR